MKFNYVYNQIMLYKRSLLNHFNQKTCLQNFYFFLPLLVGNIFHCIIFTAMWAVMAQEATTEADGGDDGGDDGLEPSGEDGSGFEPNNAQIWGCWPRCPRGYYCRRVRICWLWVFW